MKKHVGDLVKRFAHDERGASLLEYTVLLGIITIAAIASIGLVGDWVAGRWSTFVTTLTTQDPN